MSPAPLMPHISPLFLSSLCSLKAAILFVGRSIYLRGAHDFSITEFLGSPSGISGHAMGPADATSHRASHLW